MSAVEYLGMGLLMMVAVGVMGFLLVTLIIVYTVRRLATRVVDKVVDRGLAVGERGLVEGANRLGTYISDEIRKNDVDRIEMEVAMLARNAKGELTVASVMAGLKVERHVAQRGLDILCKQKQCFVEVRHGQMVYLFPSFKQKKQVMACEYCGGNYDPDDVKDACPSCGAKLQERTTLQ